MTKQQFVKVIDNNNKIADLSCENHSLRTEVRKLEEEKEKLLSIIDNLSKALANENTL